MYRGRGPLMSPAIAEIPVRTRLAVKSRFQTLLSRIEPGTQEQQIFEQHYLTVKKRLSAVLV
jgi:hypothetical protein